MNIQVKLWKVITLPLLFIAAVVWAADLRVTGLPELTDGNLAIDDWVECIDKSDTTDDAAGSSKKCSLATLRSRIFGAGSATAGSWPKLVAGTLLTTAEDGAVEKDANSVYITTAAGNRSEVQLCHLIRQDAAYTLLSQTTAQKIFNSSANGQLQLEAGTYIFDGLLALTAMSATSGNLTFDMAGGTATLGTILWQGHGNDAASDHTTATWQGSYSTDNTLTATTLFTASTATTASATLSGTFEVTAAGTWQPRVLLQTAAAASVTAGSYMRVCKIGSVTMTTVGAWN